MPSCHASAVKHHRNLVAFMHIIGSCHDLYGLTSNIHLADDQFVCVRMLLDLIDLTDHDLVKIRIQNLISFYLRSG